MDLPEPLQGGTLFSKTTECNSMTNLNINTAGLVAPGIPAALPNFPGGQHNLIPLHSLVQPLSLHIPQWPGSEFEWTMVLDIYLSVQGQSPLRAERYNFYGPIDPEFFPFEARVPRDKFTQEGVYEVFYRVNAGGNISESLSNQFTIDKTAPNFGNPGVHAVFPADVIDSGITSEYLDDNGDEVIVSIPNFLGQLPGDTINFYFGAFMDDAVLCKTVHDSTSSTVLHLSGDIIRAKGNGYRLAYYRLQDRAGNVGALSQSLSINVNLS